MTAVDGARIKRALAFLDEYEAACAEQGIPPHRASLKQFIQHHRSNAEVAGTFKTLAECGSACHFYATASDLAGAS